MSIFAGPKLRYLWGNTMKSLSRILTKRDSRKAVSVQCQCSDRCRRQHLPYLFDFRYEQGIGNISKSIIYDNINSDGSTGVSNIISVAVTAR